MGWVDHQRGETRRDLFTGNPLNCRIGADAVVGAELVDPIGLTAHHVGAEEREHDCHQHCRTPPPLHPLCGAVAISRRGDEQPGSNHQDEVPETLECADVRRDCRPRCRQPDQSQTTRQPSPVDDQQWDKRGAENAEQGQYLDDRVRPSVVLLLLVDSEFVEVRACGVLQAGDDAAPGRSPRIRATGPGRRARSRCRQPGPADALAARRWTASCWPWPKIAAEELGDITDGKGAGSAHHEQPQRAGVWYLLRQCPGPEEAECPQHPTASQQQWQPGSQGATEQDQRIVVWSWQRRRRRESTFGEVWCCRAHPAVLPRQWSHCRRVPPGSGRSARPRCAPPGSPSVGTRNDQRRVASGAGPVADGGVPDGGVTSA